MTWSKLTNLLARPFLIILYVLSGWLPRDEHLWAFGSWGGRRFADNAKALFLYSVTRGQDIKSVWLSRNPNVVKAMRAQKLPAYHSNSLLGIWVQLRAGIYIFDSFALDLGFWASRGAVKVNLWHGLPLKKIQRDIENLAHPINRGFHGSALQRLLNRLRAPWLYEQPDMVIATSPIIQNLLSSAFGIPVERVPITGYPRVDILASKDYRLTPLDGAVCEEVAALKKAGGRVVAYLPTFRDNAKVGRKIPLDWPALHTFLERENAILLLKLHTEDAASMPSLSDYPRIISVESDVDIYPLLRFVDVLITDYSSVWFDFLAVNRPVIFYAYDLETYLQDSRTMYFDYHEVTPGPKVKDFAALLSAVEVALNNPDTEPWKTERGRALRRFYHLVDDQASQRVWDEICRRFVRSER